MKCNICWDCGNACANKCDYIRLGTAIKGWTARKHDDGYLIDKCPNFVTDGDIGFKKIAKLLGFNANTMNAYVRNGKQYLVEERARKKGYIYSVYKSDDASTIHLLVPLNVQRGLDSNEGL